MLPSQLEKVSRIRALIEELGAPVEIEVDGGVKVGNILRCASAGADIVVCGSSVYNDHASVAENLAELRRAARG